MAATSIAGGDIADFDLEVRDAGDVLLTGYPFSFVFNRGGGALGNNAIDIVAQISVPAGYDYRIVDNSSGVTTGWTMVEDTL